MLLNGRSPTTRSYPYRNDDGRNNATPSGTKVVRGGSFFDAPKRCRSACRLPYPVWQRIFNVSFRIVCEPPDALASAQSDLP